MRAEKPESQSYAQQLRADSIFTIIPITTIATIIICVLAINISAAYSVNTLTNGNLALVGTAVVSFLAARYAWRLHNKGHQRRAGGSYVVVHVLLITFNMLMHHYAIIILPYGFAVFIVMSSMVISLAASIYMWGFTSILIIASGIVHNVLLETALPFSMTERQLTGLLATAIGINFVIALSSYLSAVDWKIAIESLDDVQRRAQSRRDELFTMKETLSLTNAKLRFLNDELDVARRKALRERDLRTRFMNNVSHELRTPLNSIVNFAHLLSQGIGGEVNERQVDYLGRIEQSGWHLLNILNDLLDMAQIESGEFKLYLESIDLNEICEDALSNTQGLILDKPDIALLRDYPDEWPKIKADKMRLKQSLINLLGNATKYTVEGHIALRVRYDDKMVHITVEDTGVGIDPAYHEIIFQEFRQADETAARRRVGTGLGLPITKHLIERHGGHITLSSALGEGSRFTLSLPMIQEEETPKEAENAKTPAA